MLRPELPRRLKHCGKMAAIGGPEAGCALGGNWLQFAAQEFTSPGQVGTAKQLVLMYLIGFPGLVSELHPDPPNRFGNAQSSLLREPWGSDPVPQVGVNGTPPLAVKISPSSHPPNAHWDGAERDLGVPNSQVPFTTSVLSTLKSERPRLSLMSNQ